MFALIPIIGPLFKMITSLFSSYESTELGKYTVDGKVDVEAMQASASIVTSNEMYVGLRLATEALIWPIIIWTDLIVFVTLAKTLHPSWYFVVEKLPDSIAYLPYAVFTFLLGAVGVVTWGRK